MTGPDPDRALAEIRAVDPERARLAEAALEWLTSGEMVDALTLGRVQRFAWHDVLVNWLDGPEVAPDLLDAAADLFDRLGLPRYAAVCRGDVAAAMRAAFARSFEEAGRVYGAAFARSGVEPPDLDDFAWGEIRGPNQERAAGMRPQAPSAP